MKLTKKIKKGFKNMTDLPVNTIMNRNIISLKQDKMIEDAAKLMCSKSISGLVVLNEKNKPVGLVSKGDVLRSMFLKGLDPKKTPLEKIMATKLTIVDSNTPINQASRKMEMMRIKKLPVFENGNIVGYVSRSDILQAANHAYSQMKRFIPVVLFCILQTIIIIILLSELVKK
ncbi:MAG: CBS domain-containing protein [Nanoarchaeota archaeon]|nr:CBS domain-containing protein [Nanoarchaeota archaeon]